MISNGCPENLIDSARVKAFLRENGWQIVAEPQKANLVVFNACAFSTRMENMSLEIIKDLKEKTDSQARLIVWGCLPKIDPAVLEQAYQRPSFGEDEITRFDEIIGANISVGDVTANEVCPRYYYQKSGLPNVIQQLPGRFLRRCYNYLDAKVDLYNRRDSDIFYIKVSSGCLGNCSYCAIRHSRGRIKSKPIDMIIAEFRHGLERGFHNFSLLGTDLGPQGRDLGYNLADLLGEMVKEKGEYRIGIRNVHPFFLKQMLDEITPVLATGKIWYMGMAAESGSDRILSLMGRNYTAADVRQCVQRVKKANPNIVIRTQFMVGFPTETERDFAESYRLLSTLDFDCVEVYVFSPRPNVPANQMPGQVPYRTALLRQSRMLGKMLPRLILKNIRQNRHHTKVPKENEAE